jgi:hypothetical protein
MKSDLKIVIDLVLLCDYNLNLCMFLMECFDTELCCIVVVRWFCMCILGFFCGAMSK